MARASFVSALLAVAVGACAFDPYPLSGQGSSEFHPAAVGEPIPAVVLFIELRPGDGIELLGADPIGIPPAATTEFFYSPPVDNDVGEHVIGDELLPLEGATFAVPASAEAGPHNTFGIVARITASRPGRYTLSSVRLRYRLNGHESVSEGITSVVTVCADDPKPRDCPDLDD